MSVLQGDDMTEKKPQESSLEEYLNKMHNCAVFLGEPGDVVVKQLIAALRRAILQRDHWMIQPEWLCDTPKMVELEDCAILTVLQGQGGAQ